MNVRTSKSIGAAIRQRRRELDLDQQTLADRIGASRKWVIAVEQGKDSAEVGRVLRALEALGMTVQLATVQKRKREGAQKALFDIDSIIDRARKRPTP